MSCMSITVYELNFLIVKAPKDLLDIFIHMPSPSPNYDLMQSLDSDLSDLLNDCLEQSSPTGMKTTLYPYQKV